MTDLLIGIIPNRFSESSGVINGEVVFRNKSGNCSIFRNSEMRHSKSEDLLNPTSRTPSPLMAAVSEDDLLAATAPCNLLPRPPGPPGAIADRIDPEDSIRDIVTENDLYRFVLFKRHYDKYVALSAKYEEARGMAYYLEERYHEVKAERDQLEDMRRKLEKRLEGCESELRDKEEELFMQLERSLRLEDEAERVRNDRDTCKAARDRLEQELAAALRQLQIQAAENEITRKSLERARQEVISRVTVIRAERDALERENEVLKEKLRVEQDLVGVERRRREEVTHEAAALRYAARHLRAACHHATACRRRRRCSVCIYARRTFADVDDYRDDGKLFKCLQAPLQDLRTWLRPSTPSALPPLRTSSPLGQRIGYIDDSSSSSEDEEYPTTATAEVSLSSTNSSAPQSARAFSSDSGYEFRPKISHLTPVELAQNPTIPLHSSPLNRRSVPCRFSSEHGDRRSQSYECGGSSRASSTDEAQRNTGFTRSRWTSSFRKLLGRKSKNKATVTQS